MLEARKVSKPAAATPAWPASLYAKPRVQPAWEPSPSQSPTPYVRTPAALGGTLVAEDMMEGVRQAMQTLGVKNLTTLGITSSLRGEGRTTLALATALVLAEYGMETILLELDLAHPELCHRLGVSKYPGLLDVAEGRADVADAMHPFSPGVSIVPVGQMQGSIPRALSQLAKSELLSELASQGVAVVADLPPLMGNSAGRQAASLMADLILVVRANVVPAATIVEAVAGLPVTPKVLLNGTRSRVPGWVRRLSGI